jgi:DNA-binding response OmpR family regulator
MTLGAVDYLTKPIERDKLVELGRFRARRTDAGARCRG